MFLVFRDLPGVTRDQYSAAQEAIADAVQRANPAGREVTYLGGFFLVGSGRTVCVFDGETASEVADINRQAGVSFTEVLEAIDLRRVPIPRGGVPASTQALRNQKGWNSET